MTENSDNNEAQSGKGRLQPRSCPRPRSLFLTSPRPWSNLCVPLTPLSSPTPHFPRFYTSATSCMSQSPHSFSLFPRNDTSFSRDLTSSGCVSYHHFPSLLLYDCKSCSPLSIQLLTLRFSHDCMQRNCKVKVTFFVARWRAS